MMDDPRDMILLMNGLSEEEIAEVLRNKPSENFCEILAMMLAPPPGKKVRYRLHLRRPSRGRPRKRTTTETTTEIGTLMEISKEGGKESAAAEAKDKFGIGRTTAYTAMKSERAWKKIDRQFEEVRKITKLGERGS